MNRSNQTLLSLLKDSNHSLYAIKEDEPGFLSPIQMAHIYVNSAFLVTAMEFIKEQLWLRGKDSKTHPELGTYESLISPFFGDELASLLVLKEHLIESGPSQINAISRDSKTIRANILSLIIERPAADQKGFATQSLKEMMVYFLDEEKRQEGKIQSLGHCGPRIYRTFDDLDEIFSLNYRLDQNMIVDNSAEERLYQGSGVGVQSGYSTILLALHHLDLKSGSRVIDLGSGYGRVGLVYSLLRPDIDFIGYEYVPHRVENSNQASQSLGLQGNLSFRVQDLSLPSFRIPDADVYYLFDPFTEETYRHVLAQIVEVSRRKNITIVTKGNARSWLFDIGMKNSWPNPILLDRGNLCLFNSA